MVPDLRHERWNIPAFVLPYIFTVHTYSTYADGVLSCYTVYKRLWVWYCMDGYRIYTSYVERTAAPGFENPRWGLNGFDIITKLPYGA